MDGARARQVAAYALTRVDKMRGSGYGDGMPTTGPKCSHGNQGYCGLCEADKAPKCVHGNSFYCGHDGCGVVRSAKDDVIDMIKSDSWRGNS